MVVNGLIAHIRQLAVNGHEVSLKFASSTGHAAFKVKVWIGARGDVVPDGARWRTVMVVDSLASLSERCSVNHRGHKHSDGHSVVEFFLKDVLLTSAAEEPSHAVPIPLEPVAQTHDQLYVGLDPGTLPAACVADVFMDAVEVSSDTHADAGWQEAGTAGPTALSTVDGEPSSVHDEVVDEVVTEASLDIHDGAAGAPSSSSHIQVVIPEEPRQVALCSQADFKAELMEVASTVTPWLMQGSAENRPHYVEFLSARAFCTTPDVLFFSAERRAHTCTQLLLDFQRQMDADMERHSLSMSTEERALGELDESEEEVSKKKSRRRRRR